MGQSYPLPITKAMVTPAYVPNIPFVDGIFYDPATGNEGRITTTDPNLYPRYHSGKAGLWGAAGGVWAAGVGLTYDMTKPLGQLGPKDPYPTTPPAQCTLASLSPAGGVHGTAPVEMICTGTGFTPWSTIVFSGVPEYTKYISPTQISTIVSLNIFLAPADIPVRVIDRGVYAPVDRTFVIT